MPRSPMPNLSPTAASLLHVNPCPRSIAREVLERDPIDVAIVFGGRGGGGGGVVSVTTMKLEPVWNSVTPLT